MMATNVNTKLYRDAVKSLYGDSVIIPSSGTSYKRSSRYGNPAKPRRNIEDGLQIHLVAWALAEDLPIMSIPNEGNRGAIQGHRMKQMGLLPGAADLFLWRRSGCGKWPAYFIELKSPGEKPRANQRAFLERARVEGFCAEWFDDWLDARQSIINYLDGTKEKEKPL
jgi:hypothetical protein